ncbi:fatty acid metabolism transcriptional regulator FadR, partial [Enterobacter cloacae]
GWHSQGYAPLRHSDHDSGEIRLRQQKTLPGD